MISGKLSRTVQEQFHTSHYIYEFSSISMGYLKQSFKSGEIEIFMQLNIIFGWLVLKGVVNS